MLVPEYQTAAWPIVLLSDKGPQAISLDPLFTALTLVWAPA